MLNSFMHTKGLSASCLHCVYTDNVWSRLCIQVNWRFVWMLRFCRLYLIYPNPIFWFVALIGMNGGMWNAGHRRCELWKLCKYFADTFMSLIWRQQTDIRPNSVRPTPNRWFLFSFNFYLFSCVLAFIANHCMYDNSFPILPTNPNSFSQIHSGICTLVESCLSNLIYSNPMAIFTL